MKITDIFESSTTAGAIATGTPATIGKIQKRAGSLFKGKVTKKPFYEAEVNEEEIVEQDLILVPDQIIKKDKSFIPHDTDRRDHEVEMARSELFAAAKDAQRIYAMLKNRSEDEGLMGWQQSYITLAADYLNSVADSLEHQAHTNEMTGGVLAGGMSNFEESDDSAMDKVRDRLGSTGKLQRMVDRHEAWLDAHNQQALSRMSDEERYNAAKTQHEIDVLADLVECKKMMTTGKRLLT